jgi:RHS repeat-associated protein
VSSHPRRWLLLTVVAALACFLLAFTPTRSSAQSLGVFPDGQAVNEPINTGNLTVNFGLSGTMNGTTYFVETLCTGNVTNCSPNSGQSFTGFRGAITVTFWTLGVGTGRIRLKVYKSGGIPSDTGWFNVNINETTPPQTRMMQPPQFGSTNQQYPTIQVGWCDNMSLNAATRSILVNGSDVTGNFDYTTGNGPGCGAVTASSTTTSVPLNLGSNSIQAHICDNAGNCVTDTYSITRTDATAPTITLPLPSPTTVFTQYPQMQVKWCDNESLNSGSRWIKVNGLDQTAAFDYSSGGSGCGVAATSTTSTVALNLGANTIQAYICDSWGNCTTATFTVTRELPAGVAFANHNRDNLDRSLCLTVAAGDAAEVNCGDLLVYHAMPTFKTMNVERNVTLIYNSATAEPRPRVATWVTLGAADAPQSVYAQVSVNGGTRASATYGSWAAGATRQLALAFDASDLPSGIYPFNLLVRLNFSGGVQHDTTVSDTLLIVNRESSEFGTGWYMVGLEGLVLNQPGGSLLWVGGDGSAKVYRGAGAGRWYAAAGTYRDSIIQVGSNYERRAKHGIVVTFDGAGRHIQTRNRLGHCTTFNWVNGRLSTIVLPPANATYQFTYDGNNNLDKITDPAGRILDVTVSSGILTQLTDPDNRSVSFGYDGEQRLTTRTNRRLAMSTYFYDNSLRVTRFQLPLSSQSDLATTQFTNADEFGLAIGTPGGTFTAVDPAIVRTVADGPRPSSDAADTAAFYLNQYGAPTRIVNAFGQQTFIYRDDAAWPALPTRVQAPDGFLKSATYDGHANLATETETNALGDGRNGTTTYQWDLKWDFVSSITTAAGVVSSLSYDPNNGNRLWQQEGNDAARRVTFRYGNSLALLSSTLLPLTPQDSILYDTQGNLQAVATPKGFWTSFYKNAVGLDTLVVTPIDSTDKSRGGAADSVSRSRQRTVFTVMGRDSISEQISPNRAQVLQVVKRYNAEGDLDSLSRLSIPDPAHVATITTRWHYDLSHRRVAEVSPDGLLDSTAYDQAGNAKTVVTRRGHVLQMVYDALNRVATRSIPSVTYHDTLAGIGTRDNQPYPRQPNSGTYYVIPGQTESFTYDPLGRILTANNADALVTRTYYPNGKLKSDEQQIRDASGTTFSHDFLVRFSYDLDGRKTAIKLPSQLVPAGTKDSIALGFGYANNDLTTITDPLSNQWILDYTARAEVMNIWYPWPSSYHEGYAYDADGNIVGDTIFNTNGGGNGRLSAPWGRAMKLAYDARGKLLAMKDPTGYQQTDTSRYSGLGHLTSSYTKQTGQLQGYNVTDTYATGEQQSYDALGNMYSALTVDTTWYNGQFASASWRNRVATFQSGVGRQLLEATAQGTKTYRYDPAGNLEFTTLDGGVSGAPREDRFSYYGADSRLRAADYRFVLNGQAILTGEKWVFEEYRYDALGRRIWVRAYRDCSNYSQGYPEYVQCSTSTLRRTIWNENAEFVEIQVPGGASETSATLEADDQQYNLPRDPYNNDHNPYFGRVVYTPGLSVDHPIAVTRYRYTDFFYGFPYTYFDPKTYSLYWSPLGQMALATCVDGLLQCSQGSTYMRFEYPAALFVYDRPKLFALEFQGTLILDKEDAAHTLYRRNRSYDPSTGRFTQEDPIGLAGGMNLYGFAGGDPVNFSDPFGLCPDACVLEGGAAAGVGLYILGVGVVAAFVASTHGEELGAALGAGYDAARETGASILAAVSDKRHKIALQGQADNIAGHFAALNNPNEPGGDDPKWRDKWKKDIQKGIRIMKDRLERLKSEKAKEDWAKRIAEIEEQLKNTR